MIREQLIEAVRQQLPEQRWKHTEGVMETAVRLSHLYQADAAKAELAAILHDYCKYWPVEKLSALIVEHHLPADLLAYDSQLWHAPVGAFVVKRDFGIEDQEVLDAVGYHTSGRAQMTLLDKIVCLADYIEPGRNFPGVEKIRELAGRSLEQALIAGFDSTIQYLLAQGKKVYPLTISARNRLIDELKTP